jgi:hypothetical protein
MLHNLKISTRSSVLQYYRVLSRAKLQAKEKRSLKLTADQSGQSDARQSFSPKSFQEVSQSPYLLAG